GGNAGHDSLRLLADLLGGPNLVLHQPPPVARHLVPAGEGGDVKVARHLDPAGHSRLDHDLGRVADEPAVQHPVLALGALVPSSGKVVEVDRSAGRHVQHVLPGGDGDRVLGELNVAEVVRKQVVPCDVVEAVDELHDVAG